jgi:WD40 repeat protein
MSAYDDRVYWGPNGDLIDYFMGGTFPTCKFYASKERIFDNIVNGSSLGATATVSRTEWVKDSLNKKLTTPVRRFDISDANGAIRGIGFGSAETKGIFGSVFPVPDVFGGYSIEGDSLGLGDGVQTGFNFTWNDVKQTGIEIFINGAKQTSGFTLEPNRISSSFVKKSALAALPGNGQGCAFSPDGTYLAVAHANSPFITVYERDGDSFTKLSALEALPGVGFGCAFSPDGTYLAVAHLNSPYVTVYKRDGDSFTKLPALAALPNTGQGCAFSLDGTYLAVAHENSPRITVYQKDIHEPLQEHNVVFDDPPAAGAAITANYEVPYIPKDSNHILDVQFSIQWVKVVIH